MSDSYSILVENADQNSEKISEYEVMGFVKYPLPDNQVLMVDENAPDEIKYAAMDAGNVDFDSFQKALVINELLLQIGVIRINTYAHYSFLN
jgi:hypothetical protein